MPSKQSYVSFRRKLIYFASAIIGFLAVIVIPVELYRPIETLNKMIQSSKGAIGGLESAFRPNDLVKMNTFAMQTTRQLYDDNRGVPEEDLLYYGLTFNMLISEGTVLPEEDIRESIEYLGSFEEAGGFDYSKVIEAAWYWDQRFTAAPELLPLYSNYKAVVLNAKENSAEAGIDIGDIFIMTDSGKKAGYFESAIIFLLDSVPWYVDEPSFTGELYEIDGNAFWRASALAGREEFDHNPVHDPNNFYMPRFDRDEWGTWFSVWRTSATEGVYNIFNIDFEASSVQRTLITVAAIVLGTILILSIMVLFIVRWLSSLVTRPITELTKGATAVAEGDYDYEVPIIQEDEFGELTRQFNSMTRGQKERVNLMDTMEKFLSKELADMAAKSGLTLGGQNATCTVMFTDFAGFSTITQKMNAKDTVDALNFYYNGLIPIIRDYGGFTDKYIGDAIVALFGAPVAVEDHAERAVACAIDMQWKMREMNKARSEKGLPVFEMRVGLNTGEVIVGAIGCDAKLEYTSIGETTNLANRMEAICKLGHVMMAEGTYEEIRSTFFRGVNIAETPQQLKVKGYAKPVATYGIYVDNLQIEKNPDPEAGIEEFYLYENGDHGLRFAPEEVANVHFARLSKYINAETMSRRRAETVDLLVQ